MKDQTSIINRWHKESRAYSSEIPNSSINVLARINIFDGRDNLSRFISNEFRRLVLRAFDYYDEIEEYMGELSLDRDEYVRQLTGCFRSLPL